MAMHDAGRRDLPTDVLVEILLRLPPSTRRRVRLVYRLWRDVVDERTSEMQSRTTALFWDSWGAVAYVLDDLSKSSTGNCRELWRQSNYGELVGTSNGILCLCDTVPPGGAVTLVNPATEETLSVPRLPCPSQIRSTWYKAYSFAYHPTSGQYKVVHIPCSIDRMSGTVHVLTLGEASWREVPAGPEQDGWCECDLSAGIVSVDGTTYWVMSYGAAARVVSFDLEHERVTFIKGLPTHTDNYHLTEVHGRLGLVTRDLSMTTEVWILDKGRKWRCRYSLKRQHLMGPHFAYGEYVLTEEKGWICRHYRRKGMWSSNKAVPVLVSHRAQGMLLAEIPSNWCRTFPYVETMEPLSIYVANR
ncbi:hypothetical protein VPH35_032310 [Triticum aestivum]